MNTFKSGARCLLALFIGFSLSVQSVVAMDRSDVYVPPLLKPWMKWVIANDPDHECPADYSNGGKFECAWPTRLSLSVEGDQVKFKAQWHVFSNTFVSLPGGGKNWPLDVKMDGRFIHVVSSSTEVLPSNKDAVSHSKRLNSHTQAPPLFALVEVPPGSHTITGTIRLYPGEDVLAIPANTAQVQLLRNGISVTPFIDQKGVWLRKQQQQSIKRQPDQLDVRVFRLLSDEQMASLTTMIRLRVSGARREVMMGPSMIPDAFQVTRVSSALPVRVEKDGSLRVQVKPGDWYVRVEMKSTGKIEHIRVPAMNNPWPSSEVWSVRTQPERRAIRVDGEGVPVDPSQTQMPSKWHQDSAYRLQQGQTLQLVELQRGHSSPNPNQLSLKRSMWMDFDGGGLTLQDHIQGTMHQGWKLALTKPFELSRMALRQQPAVVRQYDDNRSGIEIRNHDINAEAVLRLPLASSVQSVLKLPVNGWSEAFGEMSLDLHLPPGWRLLGMQGADQVTNSWLHQWDLWDVFLLMIMVALLHSALGRPVAALGAVMMVLLFHEIGVSEKLWVLTTFLIWCFLKINHPKATKVLGFLMVCVIVPLLMETLPFVVNQARIVLHPQLDGGHHQIVQAQRSSYSRSPQPTIDPMMDDMVLAERDVSVRKQRSKMLEAGNSLPSNQVAVPSKVKEHDAYTQTGASLPQWRWRLSRLKWTGPVSADQTLTLFVLNPTMTVLLAVARIVLIFAFIIMVVSRWRIPSATLRGKKLGVASLVVIALAVNLVSPNIAMAIEATEFPSPELLQELRHRLTQPPDCAPHCTSLGRAKLKITDERLKLDMQVMANVKTPIRLPKLSTQDRPVVVLIDGKPAPAVAFQDGYFAVVVPEGLHQVSMLADTRGQRIRLTFPIVPAELKSSVKDWSVEGLLNDRLVSDSVDLVPPVKQAIDVDTKGGLTPTEIKPLVSVVRRLNFSQDWYVKTEVHRVAPIDGAINLAIPLLPEERVMTEGFQVVSDAVNVSLARKEQSISWLSKMKPVEALTLTAKASETWMETWVLKADERWAISPSGLAENKPRGRGEWQPVWTPWPGESLTLDVVALPLSPGVSVTVDSAKFHYEPGERVAETKASIAVRNSTGQELTVRLPVNAEIQQLSVDKRERPVRFEKGLLRILLAPGNHAVEWTWRDEQERGSSIKTPSVEFDQPVSNIGLSIDVPRDQWLLWVRGPDLGPAILYWGELVAVLLLAVLLGRLPRSPLKTAEWVLLGLGLSAQNLWAAGAVAIAMFGLALRPQWRAAVAPVWHNLLQIFLAFFWVIAMGAVMLAVPEGLGLFGRVDMGVTGNGSHAYWLNWYQDMSNGLIPQAEAIVVPLWVYRVLMLMWSFWLARALVRWALWSWSLWSAGGILSPIRTTRSKGSSKKESASSDSHGGSEDKGKEPGKNRLTLMSQPAYQTVESDWVLLMTDGCHLCDEAIVWLSGHGISQTHYNLRDVAEKPEWVEQWGDQIPVMLNEATNEAFVWPFADTRLAQSFEHLKSDSDES